MAAGVIADVGDAVVSPPKIFSDPLLVRPVATSAGGGSRSTRVPPLASGINGPLIL